MRRIATALLLGFLGAAVAHADTVSFDFVGSTDTSGFGGSSLGLGSFSFSGPLTSVTLANLTDFNFAQTTMIPGDGNATFSYGLIDLNSFSATLSGNDLLSLTLSTSLLPGISGSGPAFNPEAFTVISLDANDAYTSSDTPPLGAQKIFIGDVTESRTVAGSLVPEPSSLILMSTGFLSLVGATRRRFTVR